MAMELELESNFGGDTELAIGFNLKEMTLRRYTKRTISRHRVKSKPA